MDNIIHIFIEMNAIKNKDIFREIKRELVNVYLCVF